MDGGRLVNALSGAVSLPNAITLAGTVTIVCDTGMDWHGKVTVADAGSTLSVVNAGLPTPDGTSAAKHLLFDASSILTGSANSALTLTAAPGFPNAMVELAGAVSTHVIARLATLVLDGNLAATGTIDLERGAGDLGIAAAALTGSGIVNVKTGTDLIGAVQNPQFSGAVAALGGSITLMPGPGVLTSGLNILLGTGSLTLADGRLTNKAVGHFIFLANGTAGGSKVTLSSTPGQSSTLIDVSSGLALGGTIVVDPAAGSALNVKSGVMDSGRPFLTPGLYLSATDGMTGGSLALTGGFVEIVTPVYGAPIANAEIVADQEIAIDGNFAGSLTVNKDGTADFGDLVGHFTTGHGVAGTGKVDLLGKLVTPYSNSGFQGAITIDQGEIDLTTARAGLGTGSLTLNGGALNDQASAVLTLANGTAPNTAVTFGPDNPNHPLSIDVGAGLEIGGTIQIDTKGITLNTQGTVPMQADGTAKGRLLLEPQGGMRGGPVTIARGSVEIVGSVSGALANEFTVSNAAHLAIDGNFAGSVTVTGGTLALGFSAPITGNGFVFVKGGQLVSANSNANFAGAVSLELGGTIQVGAPNALGAGNLFLSGGRLEGSFSLENVVTMTGNVAIANGAKLAFDHSFHVTANSVISLSGGSELDLQFLSIAAGDTLTVNGTGTLGLPNGTVINGLKVVKPGVTVKKL